MLFLQEYVMVCVCETQVLYEDSSLCSSCVKWLLKFEDKGGKAVGSACESAR